MGKRRQKIKPSTSLMPDASSVEAPPAATSDASMLGDTAGQSLQGAASPEVLDLLGLHAQQMEGVTLRQLKGGDRFLAYFLRKAGFENADRIPAEARALLAEKTNTIYTTAKELAKQATTSEERQAITKVWKQMLGGLSAGLQSQTGGDASKIGSALTKVFSRDAIPEVAEAGAGLGSKIIRAAGSGPALLGLGALALGAKIWRGHQPEKLPKLRSAQELYDAMRLQDMETSNTAREISSSGMSVTQFDKLTKMRNEDAMGSPASPLTSVMPASSGYGS